MSKVVMRRAVAIGVAACFVLIGAVSMAEAGRGGGGFKGGGGGISAAAPSEAAISTGAAAAWAKFHTNQGGKFTYRGGGGGAKFHTNPGGKYVYRGSGRSSTPIPAANTPIAAGRANTTSITITAITADTAITPGTASRSIPMAAGAPISISAPWRPAAPIGGIATGGAAALLGLLLRPSTALRLLMACSLVERRQSALCRLRARIPRCHETPKCLWWATFCAKSDGKVNAARRAALPQPLRSATIGAGSTRRPTLHKRPCRRSLLSIAVRMSIMAWPKRSRPASGASSPTIPAPIPFSAPIAISSAAARSPSSIRVPPTSGI